MKNKYSKKQIQEAIKYWSKRLNEAYSRPYEERCTYAVAGKLIKILKTNKNIYIPGIGDNTDKGYITNIILPAPKNGGVDGLIFQTTFENKDLNDVLADVERDPVKWISLTLSYTTEKGAWYSVKSLNVTQRNSNMTPLYIHLLEVTMNHLREMNLRLPDIGE